MKYDVYEVKTLDSAVRLKALLRKLGKKPDFSIYSPVLDIVNYYKKTGETMYIIVWKNARYTTISANKVFEPINASLINLIHFDGSLSIKELLLERQTK